MRPIILQAAILALLLVSCSHDPQVRPLELPTPVAISGPQVRVAQYGQPLTMTGAPMSIGQPAPNAVLRTPASREFQLWQLRGKVVLVSVVPELGTTVCDRSTQRFDAVIQQMPGVAAVVVSDDYPYVQDRWQREHDISRVQLLSDTPLRSFGQAYGMQIKETGRLGRAVFILDRKFTIRYIEVQRELSLDPNYDAAVAMIRQLQAEES
jgi:thioredoxin-dependent peroxiredoxin